MAKKIAVYGVSGSLESGELKKTVAKCMVRQLYACWVVENVSIQRLSVREFRPSSAPQLRPVYTPYIPEILPPVELPGVIFVPPIGLPSWLPYAYLALSI